MNDDGVRARHIDAGFDNRGAQQDVEALLIKAFHDLFKIALAHLAMGHCDARLGHELFQAGASIMNRFNFVMQKVSLSTTLEFAQQCFANGAVIFATHKRFDR